MIFSQTFAPGFLKTLPPFFNYFLPFLRFLVFCGYFFHSLGGGFFPKWLPMFSGLNPV